jgi:hypothetical protein
VRAPALPYDGKTTRRQDDKRQRRQERQSKSKLPHHILLSCDNAAPSKNYFVAMSHEEASPDELISRLSHRPRGIINGVISLSEPARYSSIKCVTNTSSVGVLECLPLELLQYIFSMLDLQSLSRVSRVSTRGKCMVELLPAYRDLMERAPHIFTILGRVDFINVHSIGILYRALLSEICISCREYGAFLFLPTCERCCYECLFRNRSL